MQEINFCWRRHGAVMRETEREEENRGKQVNLRLCYWAENYHGQWGLKPQRTFWRTTKNGPQDSLLKTQKVGRCPPCSLGQGVSQGVLTPWNSHICLWTKVVVSCGHHICKDEAKVCRRAWARAVAVYSCAQLFLRQCLWGTETHAVKMKAGCKEANISLHSVLFF